MESLMHSEQLFNLLFGKVPDPDDVKRWKSQGWRFSSEFPFVIDQQQGGPCGILAPVQAFLLKKMIFDDNDNLETVEKLRSVDPSRIKDSLQSVLLLLLKRAVPGNNAPVNLVKINDHGKFVNESLIDLEYFTALDFTASLVSSRGIHQTKQDMDDPETPLIGTFGHCSQELLNLVLFGKASSNVFDGEQTLGDNVMTLRGVPLESSIEVGLLSELEVLRYVTVGSKLKNPNFPLWIIGSPSHYTLLFSFDISCSSRSPSETRKDKIRSKFNEFSMDDGIALAENLPKIVSALGFPGSVLSDDVSKKLIAEGIVIYDDFLKWALSYQSDSDDGANKKISESETDFFFINGQTPVQVVHVKASTAPCVKTNSSIAGSLECIMQTRWPGVHLSVSPLSV